MDSPKDLSSAPRTESLALDGRRYGPLPSLGITESDGLCTVTAVDRPLKMAEVVEGGEAEERKGVDPVPDLLRH